MWHSIEANMATPREDEVVLISPAGRAWLTSAMQRAEIIHRKGGKWAVVAARPHEGWTSFSLREILMVSTPQPKTEATPMNDQMQYIVIEGRKPQDSSKPTRALLILPKWVSPTLACAGIVGRVIELTDGNVIEQGLLPSGEQDLLAEIRADMLENAESQQGPSLNQMVPDHPTPEMKADDRHEQELQAEGVVAPVALLNEDPHVAGNAYRQGAQAERNSTLGAMSRAGMPPNTRPMDWINGLVSKLAETEALLATTQACLEAVQEPEAVPITPDREFINRLCLEFGAFAGDTWRKWLREQLEELAQFRKDRPETLAKLQAAEDNLDAWRDAAGAADLVQVCDTQTGRIKALLAQDQATQQITPGALPSDMDLNTLCGAYGCLPGEDRMVWLQRKLNELVQAHGELGDRDEELSQLRQGLDKIRKTAKKALR